MAQRVILTEPSSEGGLQGRLDLRSRRRLIEATQRKDAGEPDPGGAVAPCGHEACLIAVPLDPPGAAVAQVRPVLRLGREEAALVSDGRTLGRPEARLTGEVGQFPERPRDAGVAVC